MEACTVTAFDVITAFAVPDPSRLLAELAGFFGSERPVNHFTEPVTQPTSVWQRFIDASLSAIDANPDIGYALAAGSCEGVNNVDACTVLACHAITAFAVSGPNLLLAERVGFFGSERPVNCFTGTITQSIRISNCLLKPTLLTVDAGNPK